MNLTLILFFVLALVAVASAAGLLISRNAVYAALFLVLNFASVAVYYCCSAHPSSPGAGDRLCRSHHGVVPVRHHAARCRKASSG